MRKALIPIGLAAVLVALVATELAYDSVSAFWIEHPMIAALVASGVTLAVTALVVDAVIRRREARRWDVVAEAAYRELSTDAYVFFVGLLDVLGIPEEERRFTDQTRPILSERFHAEVNRRLDSEAGREELREFIYSQTERLGRSIARWAPIMLQTPELAAAMSDFAHLRDTLITANMGFHAAEADPNWRWGFWTSLDYFFLLFAHFDGKRRRALGEPNLLGTGDADYRASWGLPERDVPADLQGR